MNQTTQPCILTRGDETLLYTLERKPVRNLNLRIRQDGAVYVSAHPRVPLRQIESFLLSRWERITSARASFAQKQRSLPTLEDGSILPYLGAPLSLHLSKGAKLSFSLDGDTLTLTLSPHTSYEQKAALVREFYRARCLALFPAVVQEQLPLLAAWNVPSPQLRVRDMTSRWGSCIPSKKAITLNLQLIAYPLPCIEYVVLHELCHFVHADHSSRFHALMTSLMPDWKAHRARLKLPPLGE